MNVNINALAMLVRLKISKLGSTKVDKDWSSELTSNENMAENSAKIYKVLFTGADLKPINQVCNAARDLVKKYTLPWNDQGQRMLPSSVYSEFNQKMTALQNDFDVAVRSLSANYQNILADAKIRLAGKYKPEEYPTDIEKKFGWDLDVVPMPKGSDLRITTISEEEQQRLQEEVTKKTMEKMKSSASEVISRILEAITVLLQGTDGKGGLMNPDARFHVSSITKLREILEIAPALNVLDNPELNDLVDKLKLTLDVDSLDADEIRNDKNTRNEIIESSLSAVNEIQSAMGGIAA